RSHLILAASASSGCSPTAATAMPAVPFATVVLRKSLRLTGFGVSRSMPMAFSLLKLKGQRTTGWLRLFCENDPLCSLGYELLICGRKAFKLKNACKEFNMCIAAQRILTPHRHGVPYLSEAFLQRFPVPARPKRRTSEIHRLAVRRMKIASMTTRAT